MKNIYQVINDIQKDLASSGIGKNQTNTYDKYKFRGIDDVYNAVSPLLAKHGMCILPEVLDRNVQERISAKNQALFYVTVKVKYTLVSASDGSKHEITAYGEAMDRGDKATNKAMSAAFKYALFQTFCIPTEAQDADAETHNVQSGDVAEFEQKMRNAQTIEDLAGTWNQVNAIFKKRPTDKSHLENIKNEMKSKLEKQAA